MSIKYISANMNSHKSSFTDGFDSSDFDENVPFKLSIANKKESDLVEGGFSKSTHQKINENNAKSIPSHGNNR